MSASLRRVEGLGQDRDARCRGRIAGASRPPRRDAPRGRSGCCRRRSLGRRRPTGAQMPSGPAYQVSRSPWALQHRQHRARHAATGGSVLVVVVPIHARGGPILLADGVHVVEVPQNVDVGRPDVGRERLWRRAPPVERVIHDGIGSARQQALGQRCGAGPGLVSGRTPVVAVRTILAVMPFGDLDSARGRWSALFGRDPDVVPMPSDLEWYAPERRRPTARRRRRRSRDRPGHCGGRRHRRSPRRCRPARRRGAGRRDVSLRPVPDCDADRSRRNRVTLAQELTG